MRTQSTAWKILAMLMLVNMFMNLDRTILQMVAEPIKLEFSLSDGQLGILLGLAFSIPYGLAGVLLGPVIDRVNRTSWLSIIVAIWSGMTFLSGLATNYIAILLARAGLGASEAMGSPAALSLISDIFPPSRRSTAVGIFKMGVPLGVLLASVIVGHVAATYGWRVAFFYAGIPGFIVALAIFLMMREPRRGAFDQAESGAGTVPYWGALNFVFNSPVVTPFAIALLLAVFSGASLSGFAAPFLQRYHDVTLEAVGFYFGIGSMLSIASPIVVGLIADHITGKGLHYTMFFLGAFTATIGAVAISMVLSSHLQVVFGSFLVWQILTLGLTAPCFGILISLTPPTLRGGVIALIGVGNMCIGFGLGPIVVGYISDWLGGEHALRYALVSVIASSSAAAGLLFCFAARILARQQWYSRENPTCH